MAALLCMPAALFAQANPTQGEPPKSAQHLGPVSLVPTVSLTNVGWDSNVFNRQLDAEPRGDFTATATPQVQSWLRIGRARVQGRSRFDFAYFQEHAHERSVDADHEGGLSVPLARVTPYASVRWLSARQRFGFEIDERTRRRELAGVAGLDVRLGPRTHIDLSARRKRLEFDRTTGVHDPLVSHFYDHDSEGLAVSVRQQVTPLTSIAVTADRHDDRFDLVPWRNSRSLGIASGVEFQPFALISGRASVGWRRVELVEPGSPPFSGLVTKVDLAYTLLGATRFAVQAERDMAYSALQGQHAFLLAGMRGVVTHALGSGWDVGARIGRHRVSYGLFRMPGDPGADQQVGQFDGEREILTEYGGEVGYRLGPDVRIAFELGQLRRGSSVDAAREYVRTRTSMSLNYRF